jgi:hypothetical protein
MLSSTLLSLFVVPCMYTYFDDVQTLILRLWGWRPFRARAAEARPEGAARPRLEEMEVGSRT